MTEEAQRIAIAEACGWQALPTGDGLWRIKPPKPNQIVAERFETKEAGLLAYAPDYPHDLNACHEMEKLLENRNRDFEYDLMQRYYGTELQTVVGGVLGCPAQVSATAAQRAEAFLRVIGKWTET